MNFVKAEANLAETFLIVVYTKAFLQSSLILAPVSILSFNPLYDYLILVKRRPKLTGSLFSSINKGSIPSSP